MAGRSVSAAMLLGFLMVAVLCLQVQADGHDDKSDAIVKVTLNNKCSYPALLVVGVGKHLTCKNGDLVVVGPIIVKVTVKGLLKLQLFLFGKDGKLLKVKISVKLDLKVVGKDLYFDLVEEIVGGKILITLKLKLKVLGVIALPYHK